jgi:predicted ATP-grasp superfamily ATP-dependent carboligase
MGNRKLKVLLLDQGRQVLPFLKALKKSGHEVTIACISKFSEGYFSIYPDHKLIWPNYHYDIDGFEKTLIDYILFNKPDATIPLGDVTAGIVARNRLKIKEYTGLTVPSNDVFIIAADKGLTMKYCMESNIPCPKTYLPDESNLDEILDQLEYPVVVKPRMGIGAIGFRRFDNSVDLIKQFSKLNADFGRLLIQEYIPQENGMQYQAEAFLDNNSKIRVCMVISKPRFYPITGGTSSANVTIKRIDIENIVCNLLEGISWIGAADVDLIHDPRDNTPKVLEINPRVTAGIKIGFQAGIDFADLHVRLATGLPIMKIENYKLGVYSRNIILETLWYFSSTRKMRRNTSPSFFKFFGKDVIDQTFSLRDPFTMFGYILGLMKNYSKIDKWKKKLGI